MLARLSVLGVLLGVAMPASAQVLADSMADFSGSQGAGGWYYGYYAGDMGSSSFQQMQVFQSNRWYVQPGEYWTSLGAALAHPNGTTTTPPADPVDQWSARRWVSDFSGDVNIDTTLFKINATQFSNGVVGHIFVDGQEVWNQFIAGDDATGVSTRLGASVHAGSTIDFVLDPMNGNDGGDASHFSGIISAVPTPGSLALLGVAGLVATRRRRSA